MKLDTFLDKNRLPVAFAATATESYVPLAAWVEARIANCDDGMFVLGINGAQGTGKSTLAYFLRDYLETEHGRCVAELSIDDLYLTQVEREKLAAAVHPLLLTRGVPGTHDVGLGVSLFEKLNGLVSGKRLALPRFDKSVDDRRPKQDWPVVEGPVDAVIFEGWCVCSESAPEEELVEPINALEAGEDPDRVWRRYVNAQLESVYPDLFAWVDALVFLQAPGFDAIRRWRFEQEQKLAVAGVEGAPVMDETAIARFVQHYERISRRNFERLPNRADVVLTLGEDHAVTGVCYAD